MKKIITIVTFIALLLLAYRDVSLAQEQATQAAETSSPSAKVQDYQLPYPGLLPDSPLYWLKVLRDRVIAFLISDPLKKAEFNLLQADKRLNSGIFLFDKRKGKEDLAESTISKGENYFEDAITQLKEAKRQGMDVERVLAKMRQAVAKHKQVLAALGERSPAQLKTRFDNLRERVQQFEKEVASL